VDAAYTKAAATAGVNAPSTSGKKKENTNNSWNACEVKKRADFFPKYSKFEAWLLFRFRLPHDWTGRMEKDSSTPGIRKLYPQSLAHLVIN